MSVSTGADTDFILTVGGVEEHDPQWRRMEPKSAPPLQDALAAWRLAERRWESADPDDADYRAAALEVVTAWLAYHEASESTHGTFVLIVDEEQRYVAVSRGVTAILGYAPEELVGRKIDSVVAVHADVDPAQDWQRFLIDGRQEGEYAMLDRDGREVRLRYQARAHHPIPGYHLSRLRPTDQGASVGVGRSRRVDAPAELGDE